MRKLLPLLLALSFSSLFVTSPAPAPARAQAPARHLVRVFVQLAGSPVASDTNLKRRDHATHGFFRLDTTLAPTRWYGSALIKYQAAELGYLHRHGIQLQLIRQFHVLFNGFAALVPRSQEARLQSLNNVTAVLPDRETRPMDDQSIRLIHTAGAWANLGGSARAGRGLYVAIVDTGIDISNPCFRDNGMPAPQYGRRSDTQADYGLTNNKVVVARAFGSYPGKVYSAQDVQGHGTAVAAVVACDYNTPTPIGQPMSGVAPDAYLMSYNVYPEGDDGRGPQDVSIAAFEAALQDGADVVNYSSGFPSGAGDEQFDAEAQAINTLSKAGLSVVVSAGNSGPTALSISSPSTADSAIAVGASTNAQNISESASVTGPGVVPAALQQLRAVQGDHPFSTVVGPAQIVYAGLGRKPGNDTDNLKADDFAGLNLQGKIALIQRGNTTFENKINNAAHAGAIGALIFDNHEETDYPVMLEATATLPAMLISQKDGQALLAWIQAHPDATVELDPHKSTKSETPDILSAFSSRGYGPNYRIKPDLVAPGQDIYLAVQTQKSSGDLYDPSGFAAADGTSFSAPHVTGAVALLLQKHLSDPTTGTKWTPGTVKAVLTETSSITALTDPGSPAPPVTDVGGGLLDVQAAVSAHAYLLPSSLSFGQLNVGYGAQSSSLKLSMNDISGGDGSWSLSVHQLASDPGLQISVPAAVTLGAGATASIPVNVSASTAVRPGDYDGYVVVQRAGESLHVPYLVHIAALGVKTGAVLLVDASTTRFQPDAPQPAIRHVDVSRYYEQALAAIGRSYTYWDDAVQGAPSAADMKRASAVIYFTGANLNAFAHENSNPEGLEGPLSTIDLTSLRTYLSGGGKVFISGMGATLSDQVWDAVTLGAQLSALSEYDNSRTDTAHTGGIAPPSPSAVVDRRNFHRENQWLFGGFKGIDFSPKGDGANDNVAVYNSAVSDLVGVSDLDPYYDAQKNDSPYNAYGAAVLRTTNTAQEAGTGDVAVVNSDEPSLKRQTAPHYAGRSVLFGFGFEGINDNTGYATRAQVLQRIFQWFDDVPKAKVVSTTYHSGRTVVLRSSLHAGNGVHGGQWTWQVGNSTLKPTFRPTSYRFPHAGAYRLRVQIMDTVGHVAISPWVTVRVR